jgi:hypothetical protein
VDHGVDYDRFAEAGLASNSEPEDVRSIERPRVGFIGGIDAHTFDPDLFIEVARRLNDVQFVMVGACSLPDEWCDLSNVIQLGRKPGTRAAGSKRAIPSSSRNTSRWAGPSSVRATLN